MQTKQEELIDSKELRERLVGRVEVLDKVKQLLLIPQTELATVKQVAAFYEVGEEAIQAIFTRHKNELKEDGMTTQGFKELLNVQHAQLVQNPEKIRGNLNIDTPRIESTQSKKIIYYANGDVVEVPNRGLRIFPRRAILRIGMLLRDSNVAKEVRTQLLNIEEKATTEQKVEEIENENALMIAVGMALATGDAFALAEAATKMMDYKNRHIAKLQETNKALTNGILEWEERSRLSFAMRKLAVVTNTYNGAVWNQFYNHLTYKYHIDLKRRKKKSSESYISTAKKQEWGKIMKTFAAVCQMNNVEPGDMFRDLQVE